MKNPIDIAMDLDAMDNNDIPAEGLTPYTVRVSMSRVLMRYW
nr:hypothetical protein [Psychrobacter sp. PraFG1]